MVQLLAAARVSGLCLQSSSDALSFTQLPGIGSQTSLSLQECLRLLEATFPFGEESEVTRFVECGCSSSVKMLILNVHISTISFEPQLSTLK